MKKGRLIISLTVCIAITALLIIGDLFDVFSSWGINVPELNMDFVSIVLSNAVVIILFIIAYHFVDKRNIKALENKQELGLHLLKKAGDACEDYFNIMIPQIVSDFIVPKVDFNSTKNIIVENLQNAPFDFDEQLMELFLDGTLTKVEMDLYTELKSQYGKYILSRIAFYDNPTIYKISESKYKDALKNLKEYLDKQGA